MPAPTPQAQPEHFLASPPELSTAPVAQDASSVARTVAPLAKTAAPLAEPSQSEKSTAPHIPVLPAPLNAPRCDGIYAYIITTFEDSAHSVATLSTAPRSQGNLRRVGQKFGEYRVVRIDYNRRYMSSAVWLEADLKVCQVLLRDDHPVRERLIARSQKAQRKQARRERKKKRKRKRRKKR